MATNLGFYVQLSHDNIMPFNVWRSIHESQNQLFIKILHNINNRSDLPKFEQAFGRNTEKRD